MFQNIFLLKVQSDSILHNWIDITINHALKYQCLADMTLCMFLFVWYLRFYNVWIIELLQPSCGTYSLILHPIDNTVIVLCFASTNVMKK